MKGTELRRVQKQVTMTRSGGTRHRGDSDTEKEIRKIKSQQSRVPTTKEKKPL